MRTLVVTGALILAAAGCASEDDAGHALTIHAKMAPGADGALAFLSPSATIATHARAAVVGKPFYVGVFPAGFSPGNDPALYQTWGTVPADLDITATTPAMFAPGAYDMMLGIYVNNPISAAQLAFEEALPTPGGGDLFSFTLSSVDVVGEDPIQALGMQRMNVVDEDVRREIENRTPIDPMDRAQTVASFDHTILFLP